LPMLEQPVLKLFQQALDAIGLSLQML
jgi:hypothetical protein